jgi:hypothetical protein
MLKNIKSKLALSEEEPINLMLYGDPQKVMEGSEVLHGKFSLEGRYGVLQKCCAGCGEDNVINVKQQVYRICVMSDLASTNPMEVMYVTNELYHAWGTCFSLYKDLSRRHTRSGYAGLTNPVG